MTTPGRSRRRSTSLLAIGVLAVAVAGILVLVLALSDNIVYFKTVAEAVESRDADAADDRRLRMAGTVVPGSIVESDDGATFDLVERDATVDVVHRGGTPDLFEECAPLVVEGRWSAARTGAGGAPTFESDRILIRHDNEYRAPDDDVPDCPEDVGVEDVGAGDSGPDGGDADPGDAGGEASSTRG